jgi:hypothetical protein
MKDHPRLVDLMQDESVTAGIRDAMNFFEQRAVPAAQKNSSLRSCQIILAKSCLPNG